MKPIPLDVARRAAQRLCDHAGVTLVMPGDTRREVVLHALAAWHAWRGGGWSLAYAREHVSVTVPGLGLALRVLGQVPVVGAALQLLATEHPAIHLSPSALSSGPTLLGVVQHELGHVGSMRAGGPLWCLAYGTVPEVVAAAEAPCYGSDIAHAVLLGGEGVEHAEILAAGALGSLGAYGLDEPSSALARGILRSVVASLRAGAVPSEVSDSLLALAAEGWAP